MKNTKYLVVLDKNSSIFKILNKILFKILEKTF